MLRDLACRFDAAGIAPRRMSDAAKYGESKRLSL